MCCHVSDPAFCNIHQRCPAWNGLPGHTRLQAFPNKQTFNSGLHGMPCLSTKVTHPASTDKF